MTHPAALPPPADLAGPWAACAAIHAAIEMPETCFADPDNGYWHYDDGGGNWVRMLHGRRGWLLIGWDRETAHQPDGTPAAVPPPGSPPWWSETVEAFADTLAPLLQHIPGPSFIDAYTDATWHSPQATLAVTDPMNAPLTAERARSLLADILPDYGVDLDHASRTIDAIISAGPHLSVEQLADLGADGLDTAAGLAAAQAFTTPGATSP